VMCHWVAGPIDVPVGNGVPAVFGQAPGLSGRLWVAALDMRSAVRQGLLSVPRLRDWYVAQTTLRIRRWQCYGPHGP
jgi:hypothetical protein